MANRTPIMLAAASAALLAIFISVRAEPLPEGASMKCRTLEPMQVEEERSRLEQRRRYVPGENGRASVQFQFNLDSWQTDDAFLLIYSNRTRSAMYWGPYQSALSVEIDDRLTAKNGYDNLEFRLLRPTQQALCVWGNERGYPYWRPGAVISIAFLGETELDEDGLSKNHDVTIR
jgi:hypothetical protein